jgi:hypothetical protein
MEAVTRLNRKVADAVTHPGHKKQLPAIINFILYLKPIRPS